MSNLSIAQAVKKLRPGAQFALHGDTYADLEWLDGVQAKPTEQEVADAIGFDDRITLASEVDVERDRRVAAGFMFNGSLFQSRIEDQKRINGAGTLALIAVVSGAQAGNLRWHGGSSDFVWIAANNSLMPMDAQTVLAFGQAAAAWESRHLFAARALKDTDPIPENFTDDQFWPEVAS
jgi:hypothetical protein